MTHAACPRCRRQVAADFLRRLAADDRRPFVLSGYESRTVAVNRSIILLLNPFIHRTHWPKETGPGEGPGHDAHQRQLHRMGIESVSLLAATVRRLQRANNKTRSSPIAADKEILSTPSFSLSWKMFHKCMNANEAKGLQKLRKTQRGSLFGLLELLLRDQEERLAVWWSTRIARTSERWGIVGIMRPRVDTFDSAEFADAYPRSDSSDFRVHGGAEVDEELGLGSIVTKTVGAVPGKFTLPVKRRRIWLDFIFSAWAVSPSLVSQMLERFPSRKTLRSACKIAVRVFGRHAIASLYLWPETNSDLLLLGLPTAVPHRRSHVKPTKITMPEQTAGLRRTSAPHSDKEQEMLLQRRLLLYAAFIPIRTILRLLHPNLREELALRAVAIRELSKYPTDVWIFYALHLVQALRRDSGLLEEATADMARVSPLYAHTMCSVLGAESRPLTREDGRKVETEPPDPLPRICIRLRKRIIDGMNPSERSIYDANNKLVDSLVCISGDLLGIPEEEHKQYIADNAEELLSLTKTSILYVPTAQNQRIVDIHLSSASPMQSAAKAPFLLKFSTVEFEGVDAFVRSLRLRTAASTANSAPPESAISDLTFEKYPSIGGWSVGSLRTALSSGANDGSNVEPGASRQRKESEDDQTSIGGVSNTCASIFKMNDDVRQDQLAIQFIRLCDGIFRSLDLDLWLRPYVVIAHRGQRLEMLGGVIEVVQGTMSRHQLGKLLDCPLSVFFHQKFGSSDTKEFQTAQWNFIRSLAAYSVVSFLLQVKDRHNGNLLIGDKGHILHIDFGFLFDSSPGGDLRFERAPFKLTKEMIDIMGGSQSATPFKVFKQLCVQGYLAVRQYAPLILSSVALMLESGLPCFKKQSLERLRERFLVDVGPAKAAKHMESQVDIAYNALTTRIYDIVQALQQGVAY